MPDVQPPRALPDSLWRAAFRGAAESAFLAEQETERDAAMEERADWDRIEGELDGAIRQLRRAARTASDLAGVDEDDIRGDVRDLEREIDDGLSSLDVVVAQLDSLLQAFRERAERISQIAKWTESTTAEFRDNAVVREDIYRHGDSRAIAYMFDHDPDADWAGVIRARLESGDADVALELVLHREQRRPGGRPLPEGLVETLLDHAIRDFPTWLHGLLRQDHPLLISRFSPERWRSLFERMVEVDARYAWRLLTIRAWDPHLEVSSRDWGRALESLHRQSASAAMEAVHLREVKVQVRVAGDVWAGLCRDYLRVHGVRSVFEMMESVMPADDAALPPDLVSELLASPELSSIERVRLMPLSRLAALEPDAAPAQVGPAPVAGARGIAR
jgi:hypothetical protein